MNTTAIAATGYQTLTLDQMHESSTNPRRTFEPLKLSELAESLRTHGLIQPVTVRPHNGGFEIVAGARRFRAAQIAQLAEVPVRILNLTDKRRPAISGFSLFQDMTSPLLPASAAKARAHLCESRPAAACTGGRRGFRAVVTSASRSTSSVDTGS
jgi:ParB/RepB/Spo0J family partition protein